MLSVVFVLNPSASVPIEMLKWIRLPDGQQNGDYREDGAPARVILETGDEQPIVRDGKVVRLLSDLEPSGRMARVIISVPDPLSLAASSPTLPVEAALDLVRVARKTGAKNGVVHDKLYLPGLKKLPWVNRPTWSRSLSEEVVPPSVGRIKNVVVARGDCIVGFEQRGSVRRRARIHNDVSEPVS